MLVLRKASKNCPQQNQLRKIQLSYLFQVKVGERTQRSQFSQIMKSKKVKRNVNAAVQSKTTVL